MPEPRDLVDRSDPRGTRTILPASNSTAPGTPNITRVVTGPGLVTVDWTPPTGNGTVTGYFVDWGSEGGPTGNQSLPASNLSTTISGLVAFTHYQVNVTALNGSSAGVPSASVPFLLFGWTRLSGTVSPNSARVEVDSISVAVVAGAYTDNTSLGPHLVSASAMNYRTEDLVLLPVWNGTSWGNFSLDLLPGTVQGYVAPVTSNVSWDGTAEPVLGNGFFSFPVPPATNGTLTVSYPTLVTWERNLSVPANTTVWQNVTLVAPNATLTLRVDPVDSALSVDGVALLPNGTGNATVSLAAGTHRLEATHPSYYALFANVTLAAGQIEHLTLNLTAIPVVSTPNGTGGPGSPWSDPVVLALVGGVALLAVILVLLGRRGRPLEAPRTPAPDEYGIEETESVDVPGPGASGPPP
jgi:Fibronectin type III domain